MRQWDRGVVRCGRKEIFWVCVRCFFLGGVLFFLAISFWYKVLFYIAEKLNCFFVCFERESGGREREREEEREGEKKKKQLWK